MEHEEVVVSAAKFEELAMYPGFELAADGASITQNDVYTVYTYVRRRDWEKKQPAFGPEAQAARVRIETARRLMYRAEPLDEMLLRGHEFALLRYVTSYELEIYVAAEEAISSCHLKQRGILKAAGLRAKVWTDEESAETYLHTWLDGSSYSFECSWPDWEAVQQALCEVEISWLAALSKEIGASQKAQWDVGDMASTRYMDSHPDQYPMAQDPREP